ncbi:MAG: malonyl-ACP O-methyltransferase BioC [Pseudomonadota bacterium]
MNSFPCRNAEAAVSAADTPEKRWVGASFGSAAAGYDGVAELQREVGESLLARLRHLGLRPARVLDLGAGTGHFSGLLVSAFPAAESFAVDIAEGMLRFLRSQRPSANGIGLVVGDAEALPLADESVDLIFSNMAFQWCERLDLAFAECRRVLRPGGVLAFSTFGERTLGELRAAWCAVDGYSHVNAFAARRSVEQSLRARGFSEVRVDAASIARVYPSVLALMKELKALGARNLTRNRPRHLLGRHTLERVSEAYGRLPGMTSGVTASFEVLTALVEK